MVWISFYLWLIVFEFQVWMCFWVFVLLYSDTHTHLTRYMEAIKWGKGKFIHMCEEKKGSLVYNKIWFSFSNKYKLDGGFSEKYFTIKKHFKSNEINFYQLNVKILKSKKIRIKKKLNLLNILLIWVLTFYIALINFCFLRVQ